MNNLDYFVLILYVVILLGIGAWAYRRVSSSADFYTAGGKLPWWLSGISHHVSGHSGVVFVAYAAIAYSYGFTIYVWWAFGISMAMIGTTFFIAPRWARLRTKTGIQSPTEYLSTRYNLPTQQIMAWSGVLIKLFDIAAKWASIGILLNVFTGISIMVGMIISGVVTLIYITIGGLWADVVNDLFGFVIQVISGLIMFSLVLFHLGDGMMGIFTLWDRLPEGHGNLFNGPYSSGFTLGFILIAFFSYSGGTWNLATRFISSSSGSEARKASLLSAVLYLVWPLVLFFPMWAAPVFFENLDNPEESYSLMALQFLPNGLIGLLLASLFSTTLSMVASDSNTISAVISRDILPVFFQKLKSFSQKQALTVARITTFLFILITIIIALYSNTFGGVVGLVIVWFSALVGPIAVPMILGLLPVFRRSNSLVAIASILGGLITFILSKTVWEVSYAWELSGPVVISLLIFVFLPLFIKKEPSEQVDQLLAGLDKDEE